MVVHIVLILFCGIKTGTPLQNKRLSLRPLLWLTWGRKLSPNKPFGSSQTSTKMLISLFVRVSCVVRRPACPLTTHNQSVNPPYLFGPFAPGFRIPKPDYGALSTNLFFYHLLSRKGRAFPSSPGSADVRDVARIHVEALSSPLEASVGRKRLPIASPYDGNYTEAVLFVADAHPELKDRLVDANSAPHFPVNKLPVDLKRVEDVTGVKVASYHTWKETVLDTMDSVLALEKGWVSEGYEVEIPALEDYGF